MKINKKLKKIMKIFKNNKHYKFNNQKIIKIKSILMKINKKFRKIMKINYNKNNK